jgi:phenylacetate-CoA ligase
LPKGAAASSRARVAGAPAIRPLQTLWAYRGLLRTQWLDRAHLQALQEAKLRRLVEHAYRTVPYYRRRFDEAGIGPEAIRTAADLARLPPTTKADLQAAGLDAILSSAFRKEDLVPEHTSGSTGRPFTTWFDRRFVDLRNAMFLRALGIAGYRPGHRLMLVTSDRPTASKPLLRWRYVSIREPGERALAELRAFRPDVLYGCVTPLRQMALAAKATQASLPPLRAVVTTAESLDRPTRRLLAEAFGTAVLDIYGLTETGMVAFECDRHDGYHLAEDTAIVELLPTGRGDESSLVVTNLELYGMPLIRYQTGDLARPGPTGACGCGRALARIAAIEGRAVDSLRLPDEQTLSPYRLTLALEHIEGLLRYQVIQHALGSFVVRFEGRPEQAERIAAEIRAAMASVVGPEATVQAQHEDSLEGAPGRKFRVVECRLTPTPVS